MGVLSLQSLVGTMNERNCAGAESAHGQLTDLLNKINVMYQYRNDQRRDWGVVRNACYQHWYGSYGDYLRARGLSQNPLTLSIGNLEQATSNIAYCSCHARQLGGGCDGVSVPIGDSRAYCECHVRNPYSCSCESRWGGKYTPVCICNVRNVYDDGAGGCHCVMRSATLHCNCNERCACHSVSEFTMTSQPVIQATNACTCVSRTYNDGCYEHFSHCAVPCDCQSRTSLMEEHIEYLRQYYREHPNTESDFDEQEVWHQYCRQHGLSSKPTNGKCACNERYSNYNYCNCVGRGDISCQCNIRGGAIPI